MEQNQSAPSQQIGTGTLQVKPDMQAVHDEMQKIDERFDALREKAGKVFEDLVPKLQQAVELVEKLADVAAAIKVDIAANAGEATREPARQEAPQPESPEAYKELSQAQNAQASRDLLEEVQGIRADIAILIARTVED